jgi:hypothetical protein
MQQLTTRESLPFLQPMFLEYLPLSSDFTRMFLKGGLTLLLTVTGIGTYSLGPNKGTYTIWMGDVGLTLKTDSLAIGAMTIEQYDEALNQCSLHGFGRFRAIPGSSEP